jgi:hypothetical protein
MRISKRAGHKDEANSLGRTLVFAALVCVLLWIGCTIAKESRKALQRLGFWASSLERTKNLGKYLYLFAALLLVVRAFKGVGAVFKVLAAVICFPVMLIGRRLKELLARKSRSDENNRDHLLEMNLGHIPLLARVIFLVIGKRNREYLVGDLEEEYWTLIVQVRSPFQAWCWWCGEALCVAVAYFWKGIRRVVGLAAVARMRRR